MGLGEGPRADAAGAAGSGCRCGCWGGAPGDEGWSDEGGGVRLNSFSLTFQEPRTEQEFVRHAREGLRSWFIWYQSILLAIVSAMLLYHKVWEWDEMFGNDDPYPNSMVEWALAAFALVASCTLHLTILSCQRVYDRLDFHFVEAYSVALTILLVVIIVLCNPYFMARMRGYPLSCESQDTSVPLLIAGVTMAFHLNPHIRWHKMIPLQISSVVAYALPAALLGTGSSERTAMNTIYLAGLAAGASQGKRMLQFRERLNFARLIAEKASRVATEFKLGQASSAQPTSTSSSEFKPMDAVSTPESVPTTTATGKMFTISGEAGSELDGIREIGRREEWLVAAKELSWKPDGILGVGEYGIVVKGQYQGIDVAVKVPKTPPHPSRSKPYLVALCNELQILRRLRHPGIVVFYGAWLDDRCSDLALVLELVDGACLATFVRSNPTSLDRSHVLVQVSCALRYLHSHQPRIIHGDLKDTNIFIEKTGGEGGQRVAKLLDFGLAQRITKGAQPIGGSLRWVAPEIVRGAGRPDTASDVFSFGRVTYFVVTGTLPGENKSPAGLIIDLRMGVPELAWPAEGFATDYRSLVEECSQVDPTSRPDIRGLHSSLVRIWERYGGELVKSNDTDPHLQMELRAVRLAARQWRPPWRQAVT